MTEEIQIIETGIEVSEAQERASIDIQVATAKKYPRDLRKVMENSIFIATLDKDTASKCRYAKPVRGKSITGPSVHLARIICQQYGNIRVQQRIKQITDKAIIAEAIAFDLQTNYAVCVEARRSILGKDGRRFAESVVETNAMAILAIAERNAILKIVPVAITNKVYNEAFNFVFGELSDTAKLIKERERLLGIFKNTYGMQEVDVISCLGLGTKEAIKAEHVADMVGYIQSLKDKEITVEDLKGRNQKSGADKKQELKDKKQDNQTAQPTLL